MIRYQKDRLVLANNGEEMLERTVRSLSHPDVLIPARANEGDIGKDGSFPVSSRRAYPGPGQ